MEKQFFIETEGSDLPDSLGEAGQFLINVNVVNFIVRQMWLSKRQHS